MPERTRTRILVPALALVVLACAIAAAHAQVARNPFAVAGNEGSVDPTGIGGWLLSIQTYFYKLIKGTVHEAKANGSALWTLAGISFGYGVFHAAGPGHGKAVVAAYMVANERALRRGLIISFLAALLQGVVAIAIVTVGAFLLNATAPKMTKAADYVEMASYAGVALLGAWLLWRKGRAFVAALHRPVVAANHAVHHDHDGPCSDPAHHHHDHPHHDHVHGHARHTSVGAAAVSDRLHGDLAPAGEVHVHDEHCGHFHAPDPQTLGQGFSWRTAVLTVFSAGARPCSGAILVLVFAHSQQIYAAGIAATFAMSLGTAITTGVLAATAVLFKGVAVKFLGSGSGRGELVSRGVEALAALLVLLVGVGLLFGAWGMAAGA